jgi:coenzyme F420-reducing hydrogenase gamma subunit
MSEKSEDYDIAIIEGSITRPDDEERLKTIRERADVLVALGACATLGGVNKLKNQFGMSDVRACVYGEDGDMPHLTTYPTKAVGQIVDVDYRVEGCPINGKEFAYIVRCLARGLEPVIPDYPVCVECKMRENVCRYEFNEVCLGPITRAGCDAPCPSAGMWCFGCRGLIDNPNVNAAKDVMDAYGKTIDDLKSRMILFNNEQEHMSDV